MAKTKNNEKTDPKTMTPEKPITEKDVADRVKEIPVGTDQEKETTAIVKTDQDVAKVEEPEDELLSMEDLQKGFTIHENMDGVTPRLPAIGVLHSAQLFELPDGSKPEKVIGIILHSNRINAYWIKEFSDSGGGDLPDCFSFDSVKSEIPEIPENRQSKICSECPKNKYKSDKTETGKACKNSRRVHILLIGDVLPHRITLPPTSLKTYDEYMGIISNKRLQKHYAYTELSLIGDKNEKGIPYSKVQFNFVNPIKTKMELNGINDLRTKLKEQMETEAIIADETGIPGNVEDSDLDENGEAFDATKPDKF